MSSTKKLPLLAVVVLLLAAWPMVRADAAPPKRVAKPGVLLKPSCADLVPKLTLTKQASGGTATVTLNGQICNQGVGVFHIPAGSSPTGVFMRYVWYPPKTPAQVGDFKEFATHAISGAITPGACVSFARTFQIPDFIEWGHRPANAGERQVSRQFVLRVQKYHPEPIGVPLEFTAAEDCTWQNNTVVVPDLHSMEKLP